MPTGDSIRLRAIVQPATTFIYGLVDPRTDGIRYVGKSNNPRARLKAHLGRTKGRDDHKSRWIAELLKSGLSPSFVILEQVPFSNWQAAERDWIVRLRADGIDLTNTTEGGDCGPTDDTTRRKMRAAKLGKKVPWLHTPEARAKMAATRTGIKRGPQPPEWRAKIGIAQKGRVFTPEHRAKISASKIGVPRPEGLGASIGAKLRGRQASAETRAKQSASIREAALKRTAESRSEQVRRAWKTRKSRSRATPTQGLLFDCL